MDNITLTENMVTWLKELYLNEAEEYRQAAKNCHIFALGSETDEISAQFEAFADEHREFAHVLECLAKELDLN